ncbi:MAG: ribonuclease III [Ghiorsea sp.]
MNPSTLEKRIEYRFKNKDTLTRALTHASKSPHHLERQEFLGDAVLGLVIAEYLHKQYPESAEGDLSKMRANLVCKPALLTIAKSWSLADFLDVGDGERSKNGSLKSESIAANAVESVIGAVFQDANWNIAKQVVLNAWKGMIKDVEPVNLRDAKSQLQELTQAHALGLPTYIIQDLGLDHTPRFKAECFLQKQSLGVGLGNRKKAAELDAAKKALASKYLLKTTS